MAKQCWLESEVKDPRADEHCRVCGRKTVEPPVCSGCRSRSFVMPESAWEKVVALEAYRT
jgi:hypothetical protein